MEPEYQSLGITPIPGDNPAGFDLQDDPVFDQLQGEIAKLGNPTAATTVNWEIICSSATTLLAERSKDLRVASYLCAALTKRGGLAGLATGLKVIDDMLIHHWDALFPPLSRPRGRRGALQWLSERSTSYLTRLREEQKPQDADVVETIRTRLASIEATLAQRDRDAPSLRGVMNQIGGLATASDEIQNDKPDKSSPSETQRLPDAIATAVAVDHGDSNLRFENIQSRLFSLAGKQRASRLADCVAYRWTRYAAWGALEVLPRVRLGKSIAPGPRPEFRDALLRQQANGDAEATIVFCENQLAASPFWLDLNRASARALGSLGELFAAARMEVESETVQLLRRLPGIDGLRFSDGTPFADPATLAWLDTIRNEGRASSHTPMAASSDELTTAIAAARAFAQEGQIEKAAATLQNAITTAAPARGLHARVVLCELMLAHHPGPRMLPYVYLVIEDLDRHALDTWEPALARKALLVAYAAFNYMQAHNEAVRTMTRLAKIDLSAPLSM